MNFKQFKPSSWAVDNKISIYVFTFIIAIMGISSYNKIPKESFPDIVIPTIYINAIYPGNSPANIENLVTKPIEKQLKGISGVKKINSTSLQDVSVIMVEFNTNVDVAIAKQKVKDAVDKAGDDLPKDLPTKPNVLEVNFSDLPIMYVNLSGNIDLQKLKEYSDDLKDKIEGMKQISRVTMVGDLEREIQINVDMYKLQAASLTLGDIDRAVKMENLNISGGLVPMDGMKRNLTVQGEFKSVSEIGNMVVTSPTGAKLYLKDIAEVVDGNKEQESYARLAGKNVITLNIIKRSGENLIEASDKINAIIKEMKETKQLPKEINVTVTGDQSEQTRTTLHDLINTIIIGFVLVTFILMFFMGVTNALFVAASVPLSMFIAFLVMPGLGSLFGFSYTMNMIVLFAFLLALGIVVDDAIVVIENTHRLFENGKRDIKTAAKMAAGEVFVPVLSGTLTTLAPFVPLLFWDGIIGKFMFYLPITLIITLLASLFVAYIINPVFAISFMKPHTDEHKRPTWNRGTVVTTLILAAIGLFLHAGGHPALANLVLFIDAFYLFNKFFLHGIIEKFQTKTWPAFQDRYTRFLIRFLKRPWTALLGTLGLFVITIFIFAARSPKVVFFPQGDPNFVYVYVKLPTGTDPSVTNRVMLQVEKKVDEVLGDSNKIVKSIITNVTKQTTDPQDQDQNDYPNRGKIAIAFEEYAKREGKSTTDYLTQLQNLKWNIPGAEITVSPEQAGPPVSKPINIEITGDKFEELVSNSIRLKRFLEEKKISGVVGLKSDFEDSKPEIVFDIDRERANREGISTLTIASEIRSAVYGNYQTSKFRDANDEYPIQIRYQYDQRNNIEALRNLKITFRDMNMGGILRSIPLSSFADVHYSNTYGGIKRKMQKRVITVSSNVVAGFNENEVAAKVEREMARYKPVGNVEVKMTGQQEEQAETGAFLGGAMLASLGLILLILVTQFNSIGKPTIILTEIFFSIIGVLLGTAIFKMDMSIVMTGVGIIALAGVVVRNGILLVEFADISRAEGMGLWDAVVEAGRTRLTPVILTATAAILGLIPLAVGLNIDFETLFAHGNPHIYFGGDSVVFWGPLSWTMIFGLSFATFLTLLLVPAMYLIAERLKRKSVVVLKHYKLNPAFMYVPFLVLFARLSLYIQGIKLDYGDLDK
ncbi:MAG TPA: efflux RND transporter permease subunit [Bacteroidia bacterium]|nr:efflux RND transporter permease subunit [Bacteroidia bacterium]HRG51649.1 efflux RND transporter permease subunit [Bacteroidia bacterium]